MAFKLSRTGTLSIANPIAMFNDLRTRTVKGLLGNQAEILNDYTSRAVEKPDVAIKVPTGGGKTLIALCIGEWRRRHFEERVVYLCSTKQLVNQVCAQTRKQYGIAVEPFIGSQREFAPAAKSAYNSAGVIAVTTYAALFNTNPFFSDAHTIILDDAHAAEGYIASHWSIRLEKKGDSQTAFNAVVALLKDSIPETDYLRLQAPVDDSTDNLWSDKLPTVDLIGRLREITSSLDEHLKETKQSYGWSVIRDHLQACHVFYSSREILIRPLLAPTGTHKPFSGAKQRIYLSATLGLDGDLERITGRRSIFRLKEAQGSEKQGLGRRLFFFPGANLNEKDVEGVVTDFISEAGRAVILTTDGLKAARSKEFIEEKLKIKTFEIEAIEQSKEEFIKTDKAVAILANRYDGIDFPDDECRLLFVSGRPTATSLHERFIVFRFGAIRALNDRILTRITQAFGRCTRSSTDYAAVVVLGGDLEAYLEKRETRLSLHPELQAELAFGLQQSKTSSRLDLLENLKLFLRRDAILERVETEILSKRDAARVVVPSGASDLKSCADLEVDFSEAMWQGNYLEAISKSRAILGLLNDESLRGYRALWHYLAGASIWLAQEYKLGSDLRAATEQFRHAARAAPGIRWLNRLAAMGPDSAEPEVGPDNKAMIIVEALERRIEEMQLVHDRRFDGCEAKIRKGLAATDAAEFEAGLLLLGQHLGYAAIRPNGSASPDGWWKVDDSLGFVFEANSNGDADVPLSVDKARQANLHPTWIREQISMNEKAQIVSVLITPKSNVNADAKAFLKGVVVFWDITDFRKWAEEALIAVREIRVGFAAGDLAWRATAADVLIKGRVAPLELCNMLKNMTYR